MGPTTEHHTPEVVADEDELTLSRVSSRSLREATGRGWSEWLEVLDAASAADLDHKGIVAYLERDHPDVGSWWRQSIAVGYEQARGRREVGQTADAGFQIGVRRTIDAPSRQLWELVTTRPELWLGDGGGDLRAGRTLRGRSARRAARRAR